MKEVCERIKGECQRTGRKLADVMTVAGLSVSIFYRWNQGVVKPRPDSLAAIARALKIPPEYLAPEMEEAFRAFRFKEKTQQQTIDLPEATCDEVVFVGIQRSALALLRPFIEHVDAKLVEVPANLGRGLAALICRPVTD